MIRVLKEIPARKDQKETLVLRAFKVQSAQQDPKAIRVILVLKASKARRARLVVMVFLLPIAGMVLS